MFPLDKYKTAEQLILNFVLKPLVEAYDIMKGKDRNVVDYDENTITKKLVWHLKNETSLTEPYQRRSIGIVMRPKEQVTIEDTYEPDIKFLVCERLWMEVEAKRIYEGNKWSTSEYLSDNDGIGRFLFGKYSKSENHGGMIGYVQNGDLQAVIQNIRSGLLKKNCRECLEVTEIDKCLLSIHYRINNEDIELYHLFFYFSSTFSNSRSS